MFGLQVRAQFAETLDLALKALIDILRRRRRRRSASKTWLKKTMKYLYIKSVIANHSNSAIHKLDLIN